MVFSTPGYVNDFGMLLSCFDSFMPKIAKKFDLEKKKLHFVSQSSLTCDIEKMTDFKKLGFFRVF
jgi:hypothetical protein